MVFRVRGGVISSISLWGHPRRKYVAELIDDDTRQQKAPNYSTFATLLENVGWPSISEAVLQERGMGGGH